MRKYICFYSLKKNKFYPCIWQLWINHRVNGLKVTLLDTLYVYAMEQKNPHFREGNNNDKTCTYSSRTKFMES